MTDADTLRARAPHVLFYDDSPVVGGHELQLVALAKATSRLGCRVTLMYLRGALVSGDEEMTLVPLANGDATPLPFVRSLRPVRIWRLARELVRAAPDLVVVGQGNVEMGLGGLLAARLARLPLVSYTPFGLRMSEMNAPLGALRDPIGDLLLRLPPAFITTTEAQARRLRARSGAPVYLVPPLLAVSTVPPPSRRPAAERSTLRVAVVGRIIFRHKNQGVLPAVVIELARLGIDAHFHVIGHGRDRERLEHLIARDGLQGRFTLWGWRAPEEIPALVAQHADVWLIPSWFEGVPGVLLEAAALGLPVVMSPLDCADEFGVPKSSRADPRDPADIARAVVLAWRDADAGALAALRDRIGEKTSAKAVERALSNALVQLLDRQRRSGMSGA